MDSIFHEKQEGSLCAQHCLNALLQGPFFTPVDLATLAQRMDDEERIRMAESGVDTEDYRRFIEQPSGNMDDSGYFSVQVISSALEVWGLDLVPFNSSEALSREANAHPETMSAYICNYRDHWFTIRKLGFQWFNLNSLLSKPELISNTYLSIFLAQLQQEGYSIFIVRGNLPDCTADELLKKNPAVPVPKPPLKKEVPKSQQELDLEKAIKMSLGQSVDKDEEDFQAALRLSLQDESQDPSLNRAIKLSLQNNSLEQNGGEPSSNNTGGSSPNCSSQINVDDEDELESAIQLSLEANEKPKVVNIPITIEGRGPVESQGVNNITVSIGEEEVEDGDDDDDELQLAIRLSLENHDEAQPKIVNIPIAIAPREPVEQESNTNSIPIPVLGSPSVDVEEIRRKRLAYIENRTATGR